MQLLYTHDYNKMHQIFNEVVELPIIKYITSGMIDDMEEYIYNNGPLSDVEDYDEFDKDETHGNRQDQQHATASDNIITDDHQNEQAPTTPLENINQQTSTLLTDLFNDNIPLHETAVVQENLIALETIDQSTTDTDKFLQPDVMYGPKYNDNDRLKVIASTLDDILGKCEVKKLDTVDLIFIPVLLSDHFWCLCFHLKNGEIELIDNFRFKEWFSKRYRGRPEKLVILEYSALYTKTTVYYNDYVLI
ncbi:hypothetical protein HanRHA438_Chr01g0033531 [Helianthus annuus]|nr:hypothetical protein HanRHA438_Chr01g0033531 [Helianthus annuus]